VTVTTLVSATNTLKTKGTNTKHSTWKQN